MSNSKYKCSSFCSLYKGQKFIQGYVDDMLKQSAFNDIEFIFLDCNSPENEKETIEPLTQKYENIKYFKLDTDPGLYPAWNIAIKKCSADIIGNWNIDDRKNIHSFEILLKAFERDPELDLAYGITYVSTEANEKYENNNYQHIYPCLPHSLKNLMLNNSPHCMPLWKRNLHDRFGFFNESYKTASDGDMWLRSCVGGAKISMVNHPVGLYYHNPQGRSTDPKTIVEMVAEVQTMRQKYQQYLSTNE
jgi:glycosyltransferase involved in cell wall biosynthesis